MTREQLIQNFKDSVVKNDALCPASLDYKGVTLQCNYSYEDSGRDYYISINPWGCAMHADLQDQLAKEHFKSVDETVARIDKYFQASESYATKIENYKKELIDMTLSSLNAQM